MRKKAVVTLLGLVAMTAGPGLWSTEARAQANSVPGDRLVDQVQRAYQQTQQYQATQRLEIREVDGRWTTLRSTEIEVAFDREAQRLLVDRPDLTLVVKDGRLLLRSEDVPGRHVDMAVSSPLTFAELAQAVPMLAQPAPVELALLLSGDPVAALADGQAAQVETQAPAEGDPARRPRLQLITPPTSVTMSVNRDSHLVEQAVMEVDGPAVGMAPGNSFSMHMSFDVQRHNEAIDPAVFELNLPAGSTAVGSLQELVQAAGGGGGEAGRGAHALEGKEAPAIELPMMTGEPFKLDEVEADVVVLDFWATWCPPCWEGLRKLQAVHEWVNEEGLSVAIYAVNLQETVQEAQAYWEREGLTMPVVMDEQGIAGQAYSVRAIPQTVVIKDGMVRHVHEGAGPNLGEQLKAEITALLEE